MSLKANISMSRPLYDWLLAVASRMGARSVPGVARAILMAVMRASESEDAAMGMLSVIDGLVAHEDGDDEVAAIMEELSDADRRDPAQRANINRRT